MGGTDRTHGAFRCPSEKVMTVGLADVPALTVSRRILPATSRQADGLPAENVRISPWTPTPRA